MNDFMVVCNNIESDCDVSSDESEDNNNINKKHNKKVSRNNSRIVAPSNNSTSAIKENNNNNNNNSSNNSTMGQLLTNKMKGRLSKFDISDSQDSNNEVNKSTKRYKASVVKEPIHQKKQKR